MIEKKIYDYRREESTDVEGDLAPETTIVTTERGEWPECLGNKNDFLSSEWSNMRNCSCEDKKHIAYCVVAPKKIWPDNPLILLRVMEKQT